MPQHHGITLIEVSDGTRNIRTVATSVIGLVATGADADADMFPLNKCGLITDIDAAIGKAGASGTLKAALQAIAAQCRPLVVVVRVTAGVDTAATNTAVIGTTDGNGLKTGMQALLAAEAQVGVKPRILAAPGLDTQPVTTALVIIAERLRARIYANAVGATIAAAVTYRANFSSRALSLIFPDFKAAIGGTWAGAAVACGLRARIDNDQGWHKTLSNVAINGVVGITKDIGWDLQDASNDAGLLNAANIVTIIRSSAGFRFWGNKTCSDDTLFEFESAARTADILRDTIAEGLMWAIDKPLLPSLVRDIVETINAKFRSLRSDGLIIGAEAEYSVEKNSSTALAGGKVVIDYRYTPVPPLDNLTLNQEITDEFFENFAASAN